MSANPLVTLGSQSHGVPWPTLLAVGLKDAPLSLCFQPGAFSAWSKRLTTCLGIYQVGVHGFLHLLECWQDIKGTQFWNHPYRGEFMWSGVSAIFLTCQCCDVTDPVYESQQNVSTQGTPWENWPVLEVPLKSVDFILYLQFIRLIMPGIPLNCKRQGTGRRSQKPGTLFHFFPSSNLGQIKSKLCSCCFLPWGKWIFFLSFFFSLWSFSF